MNKNKFMPLAVILAAGKGERMKSSQPKILHQLGGQPMYRYACQAAKTVHPKEIYLVVSPQISEYIDDSDIVKIEQTVAQGTGDAVKQCLPHIGAPDDTPVLVFLGDVPLIKSQTIQSLYESYTQLKKQAVLVAGMICHFPNTYGRIMTIPSNKEPFGIKKIVEFKDASPLERENPLCNSGFMIVALGLLRKYLPNLANHNHSKEFYLTDLISLCRDDGVPAYAMTVDAAEFQGVNDRVELARAEYVLQSRWRQNAMTNGVTLENPDTVYFSFDTDIQADVSIEPNVRLGRGVVIESGSKILAFSHLEQCRLEKNTIIGPFARLRGQVVVKEKASVGNFVELKNVQLGQGAKVKHLTYLGDVDVGNKTNIGAGTVVCNYDGKNKFKTSIGAGVFIGSQTTIIAPLKIEDGAYTAAGSVITQDIPENALAIARERQVNKSGWALKK